MSPPAVAILYGVILIGMGLATLIFAPDDQRSMTAMFGPAAGLLVLLLGALSFAKPGARHHAMHAASVLLLLVALGTGWRFFMALGQPAEGREFTTVMLGLYLLFSVLALGVMVHSFIAASRARRMERQAASEPPQAPGA